jgi:hypothetical protein
MFDLPAGDWSVEWVHPADGRTELGAPIHHPGGALFLQTPKYSVDLALRLTNVR